jgi:hypothetical protein
MTPMSLVTSSVDNIIGNCFSALDLGTGAIAQGLLKTVVKRNLIAA